MSYLTAAEAFARHHERIAEELAQKRQNNSPIPESQTVVTEADEQSEQGDEESETKEE